MSTRTFFTVIGSGAFPADMLRYDECYPNSGRDVEAIMMDCVDKSSQVTRRKVQLVSHRRTSPTEARWRSFGWDVIKTETD